jgi:WD40 repeat protein
VKTFLFVLSLAVMVPGLAQAQVPLSVLRTQTEILQRSIAKSTERLFKPKLKVARGATGPVTALAMSADEHYMVSAVGDNSVRIWDLFVGREIARLKGHKARIASVAISPDGTHAATAGADKTVRIWSLQHPGEVVTLPAMDTPLTDVAFTPDGSRLVTAANDGTVRIWVVAGAKMETRLEAGSAGVLRIAVSRDGKTLAAGGSDGKLRIWSLPDGRKRAEADIDERITCLRIADDGRSVAVGTSGGKIHVVDPASPSSMASLEGHEGGVASVAFSGDGKTLVSGGEDGTVRQWSVSDTRLVKIIGKHDSSVTFVALGKDGTFALSGSEDGTTRLWNVPSSAQLLTLLSTETGWAVVDTLGRYEGSQEALGGIEWQASDMSVSVDNFSEGYYAPGLLPARLHGDQGLDPVKRIPDGVHYPAKVDFLTPSSGGDIASRHVAVEVAAEPDGSGTVAELRLYRNGKAVPPASQRREDASKGSRLVAHYELDVGDGPTLLTATAVNDDKLESNPKTLALRHGSAAPVGAFHVLTVGINHYKNSALSLDYARPDATSVAAFFASSGLAAGKVAEIRQIFDENATKANILAALRGFRSLPPQDVVVVYIAGHGVNYHNEWYYIPYELERPNKADILKAQALSAEDLKAEIEAVTAERTLVLLDTCQSGSAVDPLENYRGMKSLRLMARSVGMHMVAATDRTQLSMELSSLGHGIFTYTLLNALTGDRQGRAKSAPLTAADAVRFVEEEVPKLSRKYTDKAQYPTGYSRGADFDLVRAVP